MWFFKRKDKKTDNFNLKEFIDEMDWLSEWRRKANLNLIKLNITLLESQKNKPEQVD